MKTIKEYELVGKEQTNDNPNREREDTGEEDKRTMLSHHWCVGVKMKEGEKIRGRALGTQIVK